jgi:hypothetical protein
METMKPCPFCGCEMTVMHDEYPNGDERIVPYGMHSQMCILDSATFHTYPEDGWTIGKIVEAWNWRTRNEGSNCL